MTSAFNQLTEITTPCTIYKDAHNVYYVKYDIVEFISLSGFDKCQMNWESLSSLFLTPYCLISWDLFNDDLVHTLFLCLIDKFAAVLQQFVNGEPICSAINI